MAYDDVLDEKIRCQLLEIEDDLLDTVIVDRPTLEGFIGRLSQVTEETTLCLKRGQLKPSTVHLARNVALSGKLLADKLINLHRVTEDVAKKRDCEIADVFARMSLKDKQSSCSSSSDSSRNALSSKQSKCSPPLDQTGPLDPPSKNFKDPPPYISNARRWLKTHFHKPYPNYKEKEQILAGSNVPSRKLDDWFTNARRRIGWTALSKRFFRNGRPETIDCAFRVFVKPNPKLPVSEEISRMFKEMETNVENFCRDESDESEAVKMLERIMKTTDKDASTEANKKTRKIQSSKPTTSISTSVSVESSKGPETRTGRKRRRSPVRDCSVKETTSKRKRVTGLDTHGGNDTGIPPLKQKRSGSQVSSAASDYSSSIGPSTPHAESPIAHEVVIAITDSFVPLERGISEVPRDVVLDAGSTKRKHVQSDVDSAESLHLKRMRFSPDVIASSRSPVNDSPSNRDNGPVESMIGQNETSAGQSPPEVEGRGCLESCTIESTLPCNSEVSSLDWNVLTIPYSNDVGQLFFEMGLNAFPDSLPSHSIDFDALDDPYHLTEGFKDTISELGTNVSVPSDEQAALSPANASDLFSNSLPSELIDTSESRASDCTNLPESDNPWSEFISWDALSSMFSDGQYERIIPPPAFSFPSPTPEITAELTFLQPFSSSTPFEPLRLDLSSQEALPSLPLDDSWASLFRSFVEEPLSVA